VETNKQAWEEKNGRRMRMCQAVQEIETETIVTKALFVGASKGVVYPRDKNDMESIE
jgi:hypothetical protein